MILGVLYLVLAVAACTLWVRTSETNTRPNYWRMYLAVQALAGLLIIFLPILSALLFLFIAVAIAACWQVQRGNEWGAKWNDRTHARNVLLISGGIWLLGVFNAMSMFGLLILVGGLFFTYVPLGQRWYDERPSNLGFPPARR